MLQYQAHVTYMVAINLSQQRQYNCLKAPNNSFEINRNIESHYKEGMDG